MKLKITTTAETGAIHLAGALDIYGVDEARTALLDLLGNRHAIELDLREIDACDAAGLQLLLSVRLSAANAGRPFVIQHPAAAIQDCALALGLATGDWLPQNT